VKNVEDAIFGLYDFLDGGRRKKEEGLEFAEVEEAHEGVDIGGREEDATDGRAGGFAFGWSELRRGQDLAAEVGGSGKEKPDGAVGREGDLGLGAQSGLKVAGAEAAAVAAGAVPLREAAAGGGAEDFNVHVWMSSGESRLRDASNASCHSSTERVLVRIRLRLCAPLRMTILKLGT